MLLTTACFFPRDLRLPALALVFVLTFALSFELTFALSFAFFFAFVFVLDFALALAALCDLLLELWRAAIAAVGVKLRAPARINRMPARRCRTTCTS
jgi:hypothetical protein